MGCEAVNGPTGRSDRKTSQRPEGRSEGGGRGTDGVNVVGIVAIVVVVSLLGVEYAGAAALSLTLTLEVREHSECKPTRIL